MNDIPQHIAIIMDGNGRWANKRGLPRSFGHKEGAKTIERIVEDAHELGIKYMTVYAFSTENWKRSGEEVGGLMKLMSQYLDRLRDEADDRNMRLRVIGDLNGLDEKLREKILDMQEYTKKYTGITFIIAFNYGFRDEMTRTVKKLMQEVKGGQLDINDISEETITKNLDTADIPDPELLIRTGGECRLSNFLMWQLSYAEFYFTDVSWPDFTKEDLIKAIDFYRKTDRRFGQSKEKISCL